MYCCVPNCESNFESKRPASYFKFPKDRTLRKKWIHSLKLQNSRIISRAKVCSLHFKPSEIKLTASNYDKRDGKLKTKLLACPRLASRAVPVCNQKNKQTSESVELPVLNSSEMPKLEKFVPGNNSVQLTQELNLAAGVELNGTEIPKAPKPLVQGERGGQSQLTSTVPNVSVISLQSEEAKYFSNVQLPTVSNIEKNSYQLALTPAQAQPSEMAFFCSPLPSYEAGTSVFYGDRRQPASSHENVFIKVESPDRSLEVSEISSTVQSNPNVGDITISNVVGSPSYSYGFKEFSRDKTENLPSSKKSTVEDSITDLDNDDLYFFKSLLPDLRNLPRSKKTFIRLKIQEIIYNQVYDCEGS